MFGRRVSSDEVAPSVGRFSLKVQSVFNHSSGGVHPFADPIYTKEAWSKHRSSAWRYKPAPFKCLAIVAGVGWQMLYVLIITVLLGLYETFARPQGMPSIALDGFGVPFSMMTFAVSLLLVFKTNSSYERWWEGRTVWGSVVNQMRNLTRQSLSYMTSPQDRPLQAELVRWIISSAYALKMHVRGDRDGTQAVQRLLQPHELCWLLSCKNLPSCIALKLSDAIAASSLHPVTKVMMDEQAAVYVNMLGACERIFKTAIPSVYTRHTSHLLLAYLTIMPFLLWDALHWGSLPMCMLVAFLLLGTENIGAQIEEPFRVLALDAICTGMDENLHDMVNAHAAFRAMAAGANGSPAPSVSIAIR